MQSYIVDQKEEEVNLYELPLPDATACLIRDKVAIVAFRDRISISERIDDSKSET